MCRTISGLVFIYFQLRIIRFTFVFVVVDADADDVYLLVCCFLWCRRRRRCRINICSFVLFFVILRPNQQIPNVQNSIFNIRAKTYCAAYCLIYIYTSIYRGRRIHFPFICADFLLFVPGKACLHNFERTPRGSIFDLLFIQTGDLPTSISIE